MLKKHNPARDALTRAVNRAMADGAPRFVDMPASQLNSFQRYAIQQLSFIRQHDHSANAYIDQSGRIAGCVEERTIAGVPQSEPAAPCATFRDWRIWAGY